MKKTISMLLAFFMVMLLAACGNKGTNTASSETILQTESESETESEPESTTSSSNHNALEISQAKKSIVGLWVVDDDGTYKGYIFREDGTLYYKWQIGGTGLGGDFNGTYKVLDSGIELTNEYENVKMLTYSFENGKLKLFDEGLELIYDEG